MTRPRRDHEPRYAGCVSNPGYPASLTVRRVDRGLADPEVRERGLVRVVDESGEDCLCPEKRSVAIDLPRPVGQAFKATS